MKYEYYNEPAMKGLIMTLAQRAKYLRNKLVIGVLKYHIKFVDALPKR